MLVQVALLLVLGADHIVNAVQTAILLAAVVGHDVVRALWRILAPSAPREIFEKMPYNFDFYCITPLRAKNLKAPPRQSFRNLKVPLGNVFSLNLNAPQGEQFGNRRYVGLNFKFYLQMHHS